MTTHEAGEHDFAAMSLGAFTAAVAAKTPAPGGGAVAGAVAAQAAALAAMVVAYSRGKKSFAQHEDAADAMLDALRIAREASLAAAKADADAYAVLNALWRKPEDDPERRHGWDAAVHDAIRAPTLVVELAGEVAALCRRIAGASAKFLDSDLAIAADLAACAARAAAWNVRVNAPNLAEPARAATLAALDARLRTIDADAHATMRAIDVRG